MDDLPFALLERRFVSLSTGIFFFCLLRGVLPESQKRFRRRRRRRVSIGRALGWVIRAVWRLSELQRPPPDATISPTAQLHSQQTATEENLADGMPRERFQIIIWNKNSLRLALENMEVCYKRINCPIQFGVIQSPCASNGSSPSHYEYSYGGASGNEENNQQHLQYKPFSLLDHGDVKLIDPTSLFQLEHMIHQCQIVEPCYQEMMYKAFTANSDMLGSLLCEFFNSSGLCIDMKTCMDFSEFTCQSTKRCVMILKIATGLLCGMWKELTEQKCQSSHQDLKKYFFAVSARRPIENLIEAAHSISNVKWPASHIYEMLVLYEAIDDILPAIQKLYSGSSQVLIICPNESDIIYQQMRVNFRGIFDVIKCFIHDNLNGSRNGATYVNVIHPATNFLVHSMELFKNHSSVVKRISCADDGSNLLGDLLSKVITYWGQELEEYSKLHTGGRSYAFLLNNLTYFAEETRTPLHVLLHNSEHDKMLKLLDLLVKQYTSRYLEEFWGPVLACLEPNPRKKPNSSYLNEFTSKFKMICDDHGNWVLHPQLKKDLRKEIRDFIIPSCKQYFTNLPISRQGYIRRFVPWRQEARRYRTPEELELDVDELFES